MICRSRGRRNAHLRIKEADGRVNNSRLVLQRGHLVHIALSIRDERHELDIHILGVDIQRKRVRELLLLAGLDLDVVRHGREVAHDALVAGRVGGQVLGGGEGPGHEDDLDGVRLVVVDLDEGVDGAAVDELDAEDVGVGEGGLDVGVEDGGVGWGDGLLSGVLVHYFVSIGALIPLSRAEGSN